MSNYLIQRKDVKHIRIKVFDDQKVRIIVPQSISENQIQKILEQKKNWIEKKIKDFSEKERLSVYNDGMLTMFGDSHKIVHNPNLNSKYLLKTDEKEVEVKRQLKSKKDMIEWLRKFAKDYLKDRTTELSNKYKFNFNAIYVRDQKTKWGSCSKKKNVSLNWRLICLNETLIDYVIIHELVHTKVLKHNAVFKNLLKKYYPDFSLAEKKLQRIVI